MYGVDIVRCQCNHHRLCFACVTVYGYGLVCTVINTVTVTLCTVLRAHMLSTDDDGEMINRILRTVTTAVNTAAAQTRVAYNHVAAV